MLLHELSGHSFFHFGPGFWWGPLTVLRLLFDNPCTALYKHFFLRLSLSASVFLIRQTDRRGDSPL